MTFIEAKTQHSSPPLPLRTKRLAEASWVRLRALIIVQNIKARVRGTICKISRASTRPACGIPALHTMVFVKSILESCIIDLSSLQSLAAQCPSWQDLCTVSHHCQEYASARSLKAIHKHAEMALVPAVGKPVNAVTPAILDVLGPQRCQNEIPEDQIEGTRFLNGLFPRS